MLQQFISNLVHDLDLKEIKLGTHTPGVYSIPLGEGLKIEISEIPQGFFLKANIAPFPKTQGEFFATQAMLANLFGQGTRGAVLGMSFDEILILSRLVDYHVEYKEFKDILEDFINALDVWHSEALETKTTVG